MRRGNPLHECVIPPDEQLQMLTTPYSITQGIT